MFREANRAVFRTAPTLAALDRLVRAEYTGDRYIMQVARSSLAAIGKAQRAVAREAAPGTVGY